MATVTKPIILDETGQAMVTALQTIASHSAGLVGQGVPSGGATGQLLAKKSNTDYDTEWVAESPMPDVPSAYTSNPAALGTASPGSSTKWSRGDHVHPKPSAADLGITIPEAATASPANLGTAAVGSSTKYAREDHVHNKPTYSASDVGAAPAVTEVTVSTAGAVTQALDAGKIYHFTGALTSLTITLNAAGTGIIAQYHFDFESGSTAPTVTLPGTVTMQGGTFTPEASKRYEIDILNGYGVSMAW